MKEDQDEPNEKQPTNPTGALIKQVADLFHAHQKHVEDKDVGNMNASDLPLNIDNEEEQNKSED